MNKNFVIQSKSSEIGRWVKWTEYETRVEAEEDLKDYRANWKTGKFRLVLETTTQKVLKR